jgi:hypothetical protein
MVGELIHSMAVVMASMDAVMVKHMDTAIPVDMVMVMLMVVDMDKASVTVVDVFIKHCLI